MKKLAFLALLAIIFMSCHKDEKKNIIPREALVSILSDIHLSDIYYMNHFQISKLHNDSVNFYNAILRNYGFSKAEFDTTLKYYAIHSDKFDKIYEDVIIGLSKMEQEHYQFRPSYNDTTKNLWTGKNFWYLPVEGPRKKIPVSLKIPGKGKYTVTLLSKMLANDESVNPRLHLYFWYDNGKRGGYRQKFIDSIYVKNSRTTFLNFSKELKNPKITHIKGYLLDHDEQSGNWEKHVSITGLRVYYLAQ